MDTVQMIESQKPILEMTKERFIKEMENQQTDFEENLNSLEITVQGFSAYDELDKYLETYVDVVSVNDRLKECLDQAALFNK